MAEVQEREAAGEEEDRTATIAHFQVMYSY